MKTVKAYYFAKKDEKLAYGDGRDIVLGETHTVQGIPECCSYGLHASERVLDALFYASGSILYVVELSGDFDYQKDKLCATQRKYLERYDIEDILKEFVRKQALIYIEKLKPLCSKSEYEEILKFLTTGKEDLIAPVRNIAENVPPLTESLVEWSVARAVVSVTNVVEKPSTWNAHNVHSWVVMAGEFLGVDGDFLKAAAETMLLDMIFNRKEEV